MSKTQIKKHRVEGLDVIESNVGQNASDISTNAGNISANAGNISTNTGNISSNTSAIAAKADLNGSASEDFNTKDLQAAGSMGSEGSRTKGVVVITASLTLDTSTHHIIVCNNVSPLSITLPLPANHSGGEFIIKRKNVGSVSIVGTIDGVTNPDISAQYESMTIVSDGTSWNLVSVSTNKPLSVITGALTLDPASHYYVICNNTSDINITLPTASSYSGAEFVIKRKNTGSVTLIGSVDGNTNPVISVQYSSVTVLSDGTSWNFI